jgi:hypothetical protein
MFTGETTLWAEVAKTSQLSINLAMQLCSYNDERIILSLLGNPKLQAEILEKLFFESFQKDSTPYFKEVISHPNFPQHVIEDIMKGFRGESSPLPFEPWRKPDYKKFASYLSFNPNLPKSYVEELYSMNNPDINARLAGSRFTPKNVLLKMYDDYKDKKDFASLIILMALAKNRSTPVSILEKLSYNARLALKLAHNRSITPEILSRLDLVKSFEMVSAVSQNPSIPANILEALFKYTKNSSSDSKFMMHLDDKVIIYRNLSKNPGCSPITLDKLGLVDDLTVFKNLSSNRSASYGLLENMFAKNKIDILKSLAGNPSITNDMLERLAKNQYLEGEAVQNVNVTPHIVDLVDFNRINIYNAVKITELPFFSIEHTKGMCVAEGEIMNVMIEYILLHPMTTLENIIDAGFIERKKGKISSYLLNKNNRRYDEFVSYVKKELNIDILELSDSMVCDIFGWNSAA